MNQTLHQDVQDHTTEVVPLSERRGPVTMGLLWITMVTAFPCVLAGFQWYKEGITLSQVLFCSIISCVILISYFTASAYLGSKSGQTFGLLTRQVFGRWGSQFISLNLLWIFLVWYALAALLLADALKGLFTFHISMPVLAAVISIVMACNNFFGFTGIANFARYLAAPLLIGVVVYTLCKVLPTCPTSALMVVSHVPFPAALTSISAFVIGFAVWGNEPDYWRYGKPNMWLAVPPLLIAIIIGQIIFPVTGWMAARYSGITDYDAAVNFVNNYAFGGNAAIAALVLTAAYFAINDSNLYGMINTVENLKKLPHHAVCAVLALIGAGFAAWLATAGLAKSLESVASLNNVIIPTVTVIMVVEFFIVTHMSGIKVDFTKVPDMSSVPPVKQAALIALLFGWTVGIGTSGVIPGLQSLHVGVNCVQAWLTAAIVYIPLRLAEYRKLKAAEEI